MFPDRLASNNPSPNRPRASSPLIVTFAFTARSTISFGVRLSLDTRKPGDANTITRCPGAAASRVMRSRSASSDACVSRFPIAALSIAAARANPSAACRSRSPMQPIASRAARWSAIVSRFKINSAW